MWAKRPHAQRRACQPRHEPRCWRELAIRSSRRGQPSTAISCESSSEGGPVIPKSSRRRRSIWSMLVCAVLFTLPVATGAPALAQTAVAGYTVVDLGTLPSADPEGSLADAVSGDIAVGHSFTETAAGRVFHATAYDLSNPGVGVRDLDTLGSFGSMASAVDGSVIVGVVHISAAGARAYHAFAYDLDNPGAGMRDLGTLGGTNSEATAVSGRIVVGVADL